ncbi:Olfactory receptor 10J1 [Microtus ochrogaster]|uniref:Olfactory receptor 10J1 n=1 Tax=Microtus ochrogaster TaxID=79684 RepID=A0A8J6L124_MICOH|nr:Olfactory receptor 10J1 [Microtus ochrogaster]
MCVAPEAACWVEEDDLPQIEEDWSSINVSVIKDIWTLVLSLQEITAPATFLCTSYVLIMSTILKIASVDSQKKTFAICMSHLTVVAIYYGCASIVYFKPKSENTKDQDQLISVTCTVITPLLNSVVYSLKNKEVQDALRRVMGRKSLS